MRAPQERSVLRPPFGPLGFIARFDKLEELLSSIASRTQILQGNNMIRSNCLTQGFLALLVLAGIPACCFADVKLPAIFTDHMVLQREMPLPVWGWADPGEEVAVVLGDQTHKATADAEGNWRVTLKPLSLGEPQTLVVEGKNRVQVNDILVGEVWLCSGQSNMGMDVKNCLGADFDMAGAKFPNIRLISIGGPGSQTPAKDFKGHWDVCTPETVGSFSGVGFFFGRELHQILDIPIGLIDNAWGGSRCESWIRRDRLEADPLYEAMLARWKKTEDNYDIDKEKAKIARLVKVWEVEAEAAEKADNPIPRKPKFRNRLVGQHRPANSYNTRLLPIIPFAMRGTIWYQGESNTPRAYQYREMFPMMIQSWRDDWKQGDFPFYWAQLADYTPEAPFPGGSNWAELREAQTMAQDRLPNVGEAVIIDLGEASDIHPRNKIDVARRIARWALARDYGLDFVYKSPRYESMEVVDGKIALHFKDVGEKLRTVDSRQVEGFAIAGEDKKWTWAKAKITGNDSIQVWSDAVAQPVAVRYGWANNPVCNVYNAKGLPLTPFRTDDWPGVTAEER